ncbi:hypothetical protein ACHQM5_003219 [Ranunculus cassubicifolius]
MVKIPVGSRILMGSDNGVKFSVETPSFDDIVFGFFQGEGSFDSVSTTINSTNEFEEDDEQIENSVDQSNKNRAFWESQHQILDNTLFRTRSIESKVRQETNEALKIGITCTCRRPVSSGCRDCRIKQVSGHLRNAGYDSAICKSKWKSSPEIPSGEHTYLDVIHKSSSKQMEVRMIIELNFRAEFEMARASEEYNALVARLPEVFVGKVERLRNLVKILCSAAKKCMKEKNLHMGPWRKHGYMKAKWFGPCERTQSQNLPEYILHRPMKPKASLLTFDLLDMMPNFQHFTAVM